MGGSAAERLGQMPAQATVLMGRCVDCRRPFRVEIPLEVAERFGARFSHAIPYVLRAAGVEPPRCHCREGVRCAESANGLPACGDDFCEGHGPSAVKFAVVKVTYKPDVTCSGSCWQAKSSQCTCSCRGKSHGGMWAS